jgi:N-acetylglutamate synthase-like GNAT family acetyltransferase
VELQVRNARITDVDGITSLLAGMSGHDASRGSETDADLLRSLIYLPNATVIVAADGRRVIAAAVLALRPSVFHGGHVGTIDLIAVDADADGESLTATLLPELVRSARNKGCVRVEVDTTAAGASRWVKRGFKPEPPRLAVEITSGVGTR